MKISHVRVGISRVFVVGAVCCMGAFAELTITAMDSADSLAQSLVGEGIQISNV